MMEVLTKRFWEGVKKTFEDALEGTGATDPVASKEVEPNDSSASRDPAPRQDACSGPRQAETK
jgi:hypothetical protein